MGTNYYFKHGEDIVHIGKRSAAGLFCLDCMAALNPVGNHAVHFGHELLEECPICGKPKDQVEYAMSFTWAIPFIEFKILRERGYTIVNEYDREIEDFGGDVSGGCVIHFWGMIGKEFS